MIFDILKNQSVGSIIAAIILFSLIIPANAQAAISLGSVSNAQDTVYSSPGADVQLKYSFFNTGSENLNLKITYEALNDGTRYDLEESGNRIHIMSAPYPSALENTLYLTLPPSTKGAVSSQGKEWIALDSGTTYAQIVSAYLFVQIPSSDIHANPYRIKIIAATIPEVSQGSGATSTQKVAQQREYTITIYNDAGGVDPIPLSQDTDSDGLTDTEEINIYNTNPYKKDTDGDGISDGDEVRDGTDPNDPNSPKRSSRSSSSFFDNLRDMAGFGNREQTNVNPDDSENKASSGNVKDQQKTDAGKKSDTIVETDEAADESGKETNTPTGLISKITPSGSVNIVTIIIIIIGVLFLYRLLKTRRY